MFSFQVVKAAWSGLMSSFSSPLSCSAAHGHQPELHQSYFCTAGGRCHPATLRIKSDHKTWADGDGEFALRRGHSLVTQLWSRFPWRSPSSDPRACRASCSFFLWSGCFIPNSCTPKQRHFCKHFLFLDWCLFSLYLIARFLLLKHSAPFLTVIQFNCVILTFSRSCCEACSNVCPDLIQFWPWAANKPRPCSWSQTQTSSVVQRAKGTSTVLFTIQQCCV